jgi:hypothetical protein
VPEPCRVLVDGTQDEAAQLEPAELAEYVRAKLNLAVDLACQGEQEQRSGHRAPAEAYQRQWEEVMAEVKRLLPLCGRAGCRFLQQEIPVKSADKMLTPPSEFLSLRSDLEEFAKEM